MERSVRLLAAAAAVACASRGAIASERPLIQAIEGDKVVVVKTPNGNRVGEKGTEVDVGDRVKTGPRATATIVFPDGSKLIVGKGTEVEVQQSQNGTQWNELHAGTVRGIVKKAKAPEGAAPSGPPRFGIRSRAAVMGVRGTDFVFQADSAKVKSELHTLEGSVEIAKDEQALVEGRGQMVRPNEFVTADDKAIQAPKAFDRDQFLKKLSEGAPELVSMAKPDAASQQDQPPAPSEEAPKALQLLQFRVNGLFAKQSSGGRSYTTELSWNPSYRLPFLSFLSVKGQAGAFVLKGRTQDKQFLALEFGLLAGADFGPLAVEAGGGIETWGKYGESAGAEMLNVAWKLGGNAPARMFERVFVGITHYNLHSAVTGYKTDVDQFKAGIGMRF